MQGAPVQDLPWMPHLPENKYCEEKGKGQTFLNQIAQERSLELARCWVGKGAVSLVFCWQIQKVWVVCGAGEGELGSL